MLMRVSVGIHKDDIDSVIRTYHLMSQRWFTHASPTLFNSGTPKPQVCLVFFLIEFFNQFIYYFYYFETKLFCCSSLLT